MSLLLCRSGRLCLFFFLLAIIPHPTWADSIATGTITNWVESGGWMQVGDGTNHVTMSWSLAGGASGWFYGGSAYFMDSTVAVASGVTDITQIVDASTLTFVNGYVGPVGVGTFLVYHNTSTGHYGVLLIDSFSGSGIHNTYLNGTWWFQSDGTGDFSNFQPVPEPASVILLGTGLAGLLIRRRLRN